MLPPNPQHPKHTTKTMNHQTITNTIIPCLKDCAWISAAVLCCSVIAKYWLPILVGAIVVSLFVRLTECR